MSSPVIDIWTDGACISNPGPMGIGVLVVDGENRQELSEHLGHGTNNIAELTAIERGLGLAFKVTKGDSRTFVAHTDSKYAIGVLSQGWKAKANKALIARIIRKLPRSIGFVWVRGHSGVPENERCDHLATSAALGKTPDPPGQERPHPDASEEKTYPQIRINGAQLRDFSAHVVKCEGCRATVIAAWSVSADVTATLDSLCMDGMILVGAKMMMPPPGGGPS